MELLKRLVTVAMLKPTVHTCACMDMVVGGFVCNGVCCAVTGAQDGK